jgi:hypothetical protein
MSILLSILISLLPTLLKLLLDLIGRKGRVSGRQLEQLNRVTWYADQIAAAAPKVGAMNGGLPPEEERQKAEKAKKASHSTKRERAIRSLFRLLLFVPFFSGGSAFADDNLSLRVKVALELARPLPPTPVESAAAPSSYDDALRTSAQTGKPLILWIGGNICNRCVDDSANEFVHHFVPDGWNGQKGPATMVYVPHDGSHYRAATVTRWTVGSRDWGHVPSARRVSAAWRAQARRGDLTPLVLLDFGDGGKWGMPESTFWANYRGGYGSARGVMVPAPGPVPVFLPTPTLPRTPGRALFRAARGGGC